MNILSLFKPKKKEKMTQQTTQNLTTNREVHDNINKFTVHMLNVRSEAEKVDQKISEANKKSKALLRQLTATEAVWIASGGKKWS